MTAGDQPVRISVGGAHVYQLDSDRRCSGQARALLASTMHDLHLSQEQVDDGMLAVSELATNAHQHAHAADAADPIELWMWVRTRPAPQLVISIFDRCRTLMPAVSATDLLDENGKGLQIVTALSAARGWHRTRSRLGAAPGKVAWFALPLPEPWPHLDKVIPAPTAARRLLAALSSRGIRSTLRPDGDGAALLTVGELQVWVEPKAYAWRDNGRQARAPLTDLEETAEQLTRRHEEEAALSSDDTSDR